MRHWNRMFDSAGGGCGPEAAPADVPATSVGGAPAAGEPEPRLLPTFLAMVTVSVALSFSVAAAMCLVIGFAELFGAEDVIAARAVPLTAPPWHDRRCMFMVFSLLGVALGVWSFRLLQRVVRTFGPGPSHRAARGRMGPSHPPPPPWACN